MDRKMRAFFAAARLETRFGLFLHTTTHRMAASHADDQAMTASTKIDVAKFCVPDVNWNNSKKAFRK